MQRQILIGLFTVIGTLAFASAAFAETYRINTVHSSVQFKVRHLVAWVRGEFTDFKGNFEFNPENPSESSMVIVIRAESINTNNEQRDEHLRSGDFLDAAANPELLFVSTRVTADEIIGDLTLHGVKKEVTLEYEYHGEMMDQWKNRRAGFSASTVIDRKDFGITFNQVLDEGGLVIGDDITIEIEIEADVKTEPTTGN